MAIVSQKGWASDVGMSGLSDDEYARYMDDIDDAQLLGMIAEAVPGKQSIRIRLLGRKSRLMHRPRLMASLKKRRWGISTLNFCWAKSMRNEANWGELNIGARKLQT